jgi:hypothetical protein
MGPCWGAILCAELNGMPHPQACKPRPYPHHHDQVKILTGFIPKRRENVRAPLLPWSSCPVAAGFLRGHPDSSSFFVRTYQVTAGYEYTVHSASIAREGTATTASTSFTMKLAARNVGAFLRRTFDDCVANQRARIYVDNAFAGTWYDAGASTREGVDGDRRCWRDEDFPLPASLTAGKSAVKVRIEFVPTTHPQDSEWTAFRYQMYSFVLS